MRLDHLLKGGAEFGETNEGWQVEWPTVVNTIWLFFGRLYGTDSLPELVCVSVRESPQGPMYIADGHFLYKQEGHVGLWKRLEIKLPPTL